VGTKDQSGGAGVRFLNWTRMETREFGLMMMMPIAQKRAMKKFKKVCLLSC
jgi:hypothetical protein